MQFNETAVVPEIRISQISKINTLGRVEKKKSETTKRMKIDVWADPYG